MCAPCFTILPILPCIPSCQRESGPACRDHNTPRKSISRPVSEGDHYPYPQNDSGPVCQGDLSNTPQDVKEIKGPVWRFHNTPRINDSRPVNEGDLKHTPRLKSRPVSSGGSHLTHPWGANRGTVDMMTSTLVCCPLTHSLLQLSICIQIYSRCRHRWTILLKLAPWAEWAEVRLPTPPGSSTTSFTSPHHPPHHTLHHTEDNWLTGSHHVFYRTIYTNLALQGEVRIKHRLHH